MVHHPLARRFWRGLLAVLVLAGVVALGGGVEAGASEPADDLPLLWSGTLTTEAGQPTGGTAAAFVRPPTSAIPRIPVLGPQPKPIEPILVASTTAASDGRFEIRGVPPTEAIPPSWYGSDGSLQLLVTATADNGEWTMAFDTVYFLDAPGVGRAWFTDPQRYDLASAQAAGATRAARADGSGAVTDHAASESLADATSADEASASAAGERPRDLAMTFDGAPARAGQVATAAQTPPPYGTYGQCNNLGWTAQYNGKRAIAETSMNTYWKVWSAYQTTRTTSWTVGVSRSGTSGWSVNGSKTLEQEVGLGLSTPMFSGATSDYRARHSVGTIQRKFKWSCAPGWPYDLSTITVYTNEAVGMTGGHFRDDGRNGTVNPPKIPCNPAYRAAVPPNSDTRRYEGQSATNQYSVAGWGFSGGQSVGYRTYAEMSWTNDSQFTRWLCGESGYITGHTRVSAGG